MPLKPDTEKFLRTQGSSFPAAALTDPDVSLDYLERSRAPRVRPEPEHVAFVEERHIEAGIPVRIYRPEGDGPFPVIVFFHGGGWVMGDLDMHDATCRKLANGVGAVVVNVDYRLAPEHPFPAPFDDALAATRWAHDHIHEYRGDAGRLVVAGTSAGGNLAAAVALRLRESADVPLALQVLIYPVLDSEMRSESYRAYATGYSLERDQMKWFLAQYVPDETQHRDPLVSPAHAESLAGLPPAIVITAEYDPLRDEAEGFAERLRAEGVPAEVTRYDGQIHSFVGAYGVIEDADLAVAQLCRDIRRFLGIA
ncbi:MAG TPA: alpha/beta hydrolase [Amycolatopsis sp.]|nr:alpha/beta hydrolase [Amycolatopsis sp.]